MNAITDKIPNFTQATLLDAVIARLGLKNDLALSKHLEISSPTISKIRNGRCPVTAAVLIILHEATGFSIKELRFLMGDMRPHTGKSAGPFHPLRA